MDSDVVHIMPVKRVHAPKAPLELDDGCCDCSAPRLGKNTFRKTKQTSKGVLVRMPSEAYDS